MCIVALILAFLTATHALPISDSEVNTPALWALIDNVRSILIFNEMNPNKYENIEYRYETDQYTAHAKYVKPASWTTIQSSEKREVRHAFNVAITKSTPHTFPPYIFYNYFQVTEFSMTNQQIASLKMSDFEHANHLTQLNLSHNAIKGLLPYTFNYAKQLEVIDLSYNAISNIVGEIFTSENLHELYLDHNNLTYIEFAWLNFDALEVLTLNDNQLVSIDLVPSPHQITFGDKHSLNTFNIANNPLAPGTGDKIAMHAESVNISNINAKACIIAFCVKVLVARHNRIDQVIPLPTNGNFTLVELNLAYNSLVSLANLTQFHHLIRLDVSHNLLEALPAHIFHRMYHLAGLNLANNHLKRIDFGFLRSTTALANLDISYNELFFFRLNAITLSLEELHVEGNNLTRIDMNLRRMSPNLTRIGLNENAWECNYLMTAMMLLQFDGILPIINGTGNDADAANERYEDNIKGIGCHAEDVIDLKDANLGVMESNLTAKTVENDAMEQRFKKLEAKLLDVINEKFIEISFRLNETANDLFQH